MSGGAFNYFYYTGVETSLALASTLREMLTSYEDNPDRYDPRVKSILVELLERVAGAAKALQDAGTVLHDFEWLASGDGDVNAILLKKSIDEYTKAAQPATSCVPCSMCGGMRRENCKNFPNHAHDWCDCQ
jgi:hypothetical protein